MAIANTNTNNIFQGGGELFYDGVSMGILSEDDVTLSGLFGEPTIVGSSTTGETGVAAFYKGSKPTIEANLRELDKFKLSKLYTPVMEAANVDGSTPTVGQLTGSVAAGKKINGRIMIFYPHFDGYVSDENNPYAIRFSNAVVMSDLSTAFNPSTPSTVPVTIEGLKNFDGNTWEWANNITVA